jgi:chemotaxis protein MotB
VLNKEIKQVIMADAVPENQSGVTSDDLGTLMHVSADVMISPNSSALTPQGKKLLDHIVGIIRKHNVFLVVRGHADPTETGAPRYPSNWELSAARATSCVEYLVNEGKVTAQKLRVVAYGDTRPMVSNASAKDRALNRRVEFNFFRPEVLAKSNAF